LDILHEPINVKKALKLYSRLFTCYATVTIFIAKWIEDIPDID